MQVLCDFASRLSRGFGGNVGSRHLVFGSDLRIGTRISFAWRLTLLVVISKSSLNLLQTSRAIISAPECFGGVGPGCDASALEAPVIKELLEKSRANNDKHEQERRTKYWTDGYKSYFSFGYDKVLKRHDDGTYSLERPESLIAKTLRSLGVQLPSASGSE